VYVLVNFGGPRSLDEVEEFLVALLTDQEVIRTPLPSWMHRLLFTRVAKKRALKVAHDYAAIGGKSPIFEDTEFLAKAVAEHLQAPVLIFHRYLPETHAAFFAQVRAIAETEEIRVLPLFPQFSYATTGSIAKTFSEQMEPEVVQRLGWIRSFATHAAYLQAFKKCLRDHMQTEGIEESHTLFLYSAHGVPQRFVCSGDPYQRECEQTFEALSKRFPKGRSLLCYQSQFGKEPWIRPYTNEVCQHIEKHLQGETHVVIIPLSFTSDHIETLFEIEQLYLPPIRAHGIQASRCPALNRRSDWIRALAELMQKGEVCGNQVLVRDPSKLCKCARKAWGSKKCSVTPSAVC